MTRSASPWDALLNQSPDPVRASTRPRHDWPALLEQARQADQLLTAEQRELCRRGLIDASANGWHVDLLHALDRAIRGRDATQLLALLDAGLPIPAFMTPLLADAFRCADRPGAPTALSAAEAAGIRTWFEALVHPDLGLSPAAAVREIAQCRRVSVDTVRRVLKATE